jgi:Fur family ferric uptake transcriptional regulator
LTSLHSKFETYLVDQGLRYTGQKKDIIDAILTKTDHFEIDEFISEMHVKGCRVARATVYRTVKQLLDAKLIQKISGSSGRIYYEYNDGLEHHDHVICNQCGKILEIKNKTIERAIQNECKALQFKQEYRSLHIYGTCHTCAN